MGQEVDYSAVLADLEAKKSEIEAAISAIRRFSGLAPSAGDPEAEQRGNGPARDTTSAVIMTDSFFGLSAAEASKKYLRMVKKPQDTKAIRDALLAGGYLASAKNFYGKLFTALTRDGDVCKVQKGTWGLAEWYPNRPRKPKERTEGKGDAAAEPEE